LIQRRTAVTQSRGPRVHERWAHLRFSVIGHLLAAPPHKGALRAEIESLAARQWRHPTTGEPVRFGFSTIERWYYRALKERSDPVGSLRRKLRADAGQQPAMSAIGTGSLAWCNSPPLVEAVRLQETAQRGVGRYRLKIGSRLGERDQVVVMELDAPSLVRGVLREHGLAHRVVIGVFHSPRAVITFLEP
jgi:hypothetical protein